MPAPRKKKPLPKTEPTEPETVSIPIPVPEPLNALRLPEPRLQAQLPGAIEEISPVEPVPLVRLKAPETGDASKLDRSSTEDTMHSVPPYAARAEPKIENIESIEKRSQEQLKEELELERTQPTMKAMIENEKRGASFRGNPVLKTSNLFEFMDTEEIKKKIRQSLVAEKPYSVFDYYHETGLWQRVAKHERFEHITLGVIVLNALWMYVDTDWNKATSPPETHPVFHVADQFFCFFFFGEWAIRFLAFKRKCNGLKDAWFVFDSVLVSLMVGETWFLPIYILSSGSQSGASPLGDTSVLRLFRLLRLSRLIRMLRSLPELMILIKGMITAMKSVCYVMLLQTVITYVFAIGLKYLSADFEFNAVFFADVPLSMYSLLIYATLLDDLSYFTDTIREESPLCLVVVLVFIALAALTVMNMLLGVLCEVVTAVAETEKEERMTVTVSAKMSTIINQLDRDNDGFISYKEFVQIVQLPEALEALSDVGVDPISIVDFSEIFFFDSDGEPVDLSFEHFMEMVLDLRETNTARVRDIMHLWKHIQPQAISVNKEIQALKRQNDSIEKRMGDLLHLLHQM